MRERRLLRGFLLLSAGAVGVWAGPFALTVAVPSWLLWRTRRATA